MNGEGVFKSKHAARKDLTSRSKDSTIQKTGAIMDLNHNANRSIRSFRHVLAIRKKVLRVMRFNGLMELVPKAPTDTVNSIVQTGAHAKSVQVVEPTVLVLSRLRQNQVQALNNALPLLLPSTQTSNH